MVTAGEINQLLQLAVPDPHSEVVMIKSVPEIAGLAPKPAPYKKL